MSKKNVSDDKDSKESTIKLLIAIVGLITAFIILVGTVITVLNSKPSSTPTTTPLTYVVNVQDKNTGAPIKLAQVVVDVIGDTSLTGVTDSLGNANFSIDAKKTGQSIRLTIRKDGYKDYVANANAVSGLPVQVLLEHP